MRVNVEKNLKKEMSSQAQKNQLGSTRQQL